MNSTGHFLNMTCDELIRKSRGELLGVGIEEGREECERILMKLLDCTRAQLYLNAGKEIDAVTQERFLKMIGQRKQRIPLGYLLGETDFFNETLRVNEDCLIPRPETEILVERILEILKREGKTSFSFLDIGTGSGAIAIAILRSCTGAKGTLLDISKAALGAAAFNLKKYSLDNRTRLVEGDLFQPFLDEQKWDLIVSNPPYLSQKDLEDLQPELQFEPRAALDGGQDGLDFYRRLIPESKEHLFPDGIIALEVGQGQAGTVSKWLEDAGYDNIQVFRDYLGIERVVIAQ